MKFQFKSLQNHFTFFILKYCIMLTFKICCCHTLHHVGLYHCQRILRDRLKFVRRKRNRDRLELQNPDRLELQNPGTADLSWLRILSKPFYCSQAQFLVDVVFSLSLLSKGNLQCVVNTLTVSFSVPSLLAHHPSCLYDLQIGPRVVVELIKL